MNFMFEWQEQYLTSNNNNTSSNQRLGVRSSPVIIVVFC